MASSFDWNIEKNRQLVERRGISLARVISSIEQGGLLDVLEHPNQDRYRGQLIYAVDIEEFVHLVPFVTEADGTRFLKTIIPSRKATRDYQEEVSMVKDEMSTEERKILDRFERGELRPASGVKGELKAARQAARNTFNKTRRVNLRRSEMGTLR